MGNHALIILLLVLYALSMVMMGVAAKRICNDKRVDAPSCVLIVCLLVYAIAPWPFTWFAALSLVFGLVFVD